MSRQWKTISDLSDFTPGMQTVFLLHAHGVSARTSAPMPLSGQEQAAWAGVLSARRGGKTLPTAVQTALVAFFAENDLTLAEYWPQRFTAAKHCETLRNLV